MRIVWGADSLPTFVVLDFKKRDPRNQLNSTLYIEDRCEWSKEKNDKKMDKHWCVPIFSKLHDC